MKFFSEETAEMERHTGFPPGESPTGSPLAKYSYLGGEIQADYELNPDIQFVAGTSCEYWKLFDVEHYANHNVTGAPLEVDGVVYPGFPYQYFHTGWTDISENGNWLEEADRTIIALYAQGIFNLKELLGLETGAENLSLTAGVRYDHYDDFGSTTNPRFGMVWAPTGNLWFKTLYGTAFRAPSFGNLYYKNNPATTGNKDLGPEKIQTIEGLIGYNFTENMTGSVTCFNIKAEDIIQIKKPAMGQCRRN